MWTPKNEEEIKHVISAGQLTESALFDAKRQIPKARDLAIDVAAMATHGGVIIIGIGEDENKNLTLLSPIPLAGAQEQVSQIIRSNIAEPPQVIVRPIPCADDESRGYLVLIVPQSARAPHMVVSKGEYRYYGRGAAGNVPLTEGEVALLYQRRDQWQVDQAAVLQREIERSPVPSRADLGFLHIVVWPTAPDEQIFQRAVPQLDPAGAHTIRALEALVRRGRAPEVLPQALRPSPDFADYGQWTLQPHGFRFAVPASQRNDIYNDQPEFVLEIHIDHDGTGHFFCGRAAATMRSNVETKAIFEESIAVYTTRFLVMMAALYEAAEYWGTVDAGLAVTGIRGALSGALVSTLILPDRHAEPFPNDDYRQTRRFSRGDLTEAPAQCARSLTQGLIAATTQGRGQDLYERLLWR